MLLFVTLWKYELASKQPDRSCARCAQAGRRRRPRRAAAARRSAARPQSASDARAARSTRPASTSPAAYVVFLGADPGLRRDHGRQARADRARARRARRARRPARAAERDDASARPVMSELLAVGVSHKTAPLAVRERLALPDRRGRGVPARARAHAGDPRGGRDLDLQPHGDLPRRRRPGRGRDGRARHARAPGGHPPDRAGRRRSTRCATATRRATCTGSRAAWSR